MTRYLAPLLIGIAGCAILLWLATWQMQRLDWKRGILTEIESRIDGDPAPLPATGDPATGLPIGGTDDNLKAAIAGETHEYTDMYPGMAKTARDEGFDEIADWFETLGKAERSHANRFQKALDSLED